MKRQKKLLLLCLALVLLLGCYGLVTVLTAPEDSEEDPAVTISLEIPDSLSAMGWSYENTRISLTKSGDTWSYDADAGCPIDQTLVQELADSAAALAANRVITDPEDISVYGFDAEDAVSLFFTKDSSTTTLTIGNTDPLNGNAYVMLNEDASQVYLLSSDALTPYVLSIYDLVEKEELPSLADVLNLQLSGKHDLQIVFVDGGSDQCYTDQYEWFLQSGSTLLPLDAEAVEALLDELTTLTWGDCVSYDADADTLAEYGLDSPALTLSVLYSQDTTAGTLELEFGKYDEDADSYYARLADSKMVYLVSSGIYDALTAAGYDDLRAMDVLLMDWFDVKDLEITLDGKTVTMEIAEVTGTDGTAGLMYGLDGQTIDTQKGSAFLSSISKTVATETGKTADGDAVLTISLRQRTAAKRSVLTFSPSGEGYVVQIDGAGDLWISSADYKAITDTYAAMTEE